MLDRAGLIAGDIDVLVGYGNPLGHADGYHLVTPTQDEYCECAKWEGFAAVLSPTHDQLYVSGVYTNVDNSTRDMTLEIYNFAFNQWFVAAGPWQTIHASTGLEHAVFSVNRAQYNSGVGSYRLRFVLTDSAGVKETVYSPEFNVNVPQ